MPTLKQGITAQHATVATITSLTGITPAQLAAERVKGVEAGDFMLDELLHSLRSAVEELGLTDPVEIHNLTAVSLQVAGTTRTLQLALATALMRLRGYGEEGDELAVDKAKRLIEKRLREKLWGPAAPDGSAAP